MNDLFKFFAYSFTFSIGRSYLHLVQMLELPLRIELINYLIGCGADVDIQVIIFFYIIFIAVFQKLVFFDEFSMNNCVALEQDVSIVCILCIV